MDWIGKHKRLFFIWNSTTIITFYNGYSYNSNIPWHSRRFFSTRTNFWFHCSVREEKVLFGCSFVSIIKQETVNLSVCLLECKRSRFIDSNSISIAKWGSKWKSMNEKHVCVGENGTCPLMNNINLRNLKNCPINNLINNPFRAEFIQRKYNTLFTLHVPCSK